MEFILNIQFFAHKKGVGSSKNGRDSAGRRLGQKLSDGQTCLGGAIIYRQRGTKIIPGYNVGRGGDDTLFSLVDGIVKYDKYRGKTRANVVPADSSINTKVVAKAQVAAE